MSIRNDDEHSPSTVKTGPRWGEFGLKVLEGVIVGLVTGVVGGVVVSLLLTAWTPRIVEGFDEPTCNDPEELVLVEPAGVGATSWYNQVFENGVALPHYPGNAVDHDSGTAWVERSTTNDYGIGESIAFQFDEPVDLQLICVVNGYAKSATLYEDNARARQWTVATDHATSVAVLNDKTADSYATFESLPFAVGPTRTVTLTIMSTRAGQGLDGDKDTALSEVEFWATGPSSDVRPVPVPSESFTPVPQSAQLAE